MKTTTVLVLIAFSPCWLLLSCGRSAPKPPANPTLQSITVSPQSATVAAGLTQLYDAVGNYSDGSSRSLTNVKWTTSDTTISAANLNGLVVAVKQGTATVKATLGPLTATSTLTVGPPTELLTAPRRSMEETVPVASEGQIPADFDLAEAMTSLYGNFDLPTQTSVSTLPPGKNSHYSINKPVPFQTRPFFVAYTNDAGASKVFLATYSDALGRCHACQTLIAVAAFVQTLGHWTIESSTKSPVFFGDWGQPPSARLLPIGPHHVGVELQFTGGGQGVYATVVSILVPWKGDVREALTTAIAGGNGGGCGEDLPPCYENKRNIAFVKGADPDYDDIVLTLSGTDMSNRPPFDIVEVNGTERRKLSDGRYIPVGR
jgi:hypothetical protein